MSEDKTHPFRHELKFILSNWEAVAVKKRLEVLMRMDGHAGKEGYFIRSLYFDDMWNSAWKEKLSGTYSRKKYRIRIYDYQDSVIRLERKIKKGQYIQKVGAALSKKELDLLLKGKFFFLVDKEEEVLRDFYLECVKSRLKPAVVVDYERVPYVFPFGDVRITFDSHVRAGMFVSDLFDQSLPVFEVLEPDTLIMEVKFTEYLPEMIRDILPLADSAYVAASKYVLCLEKKEELFAGKG